MASVKIVYNKPFWWFITGKVWGSVAMTFGQNIYCPKDKLTDDILVHEMVHIRQNKGKWYISLWFLIRSTFDEKFYKRIEWEAKREQMKYLQDNGRLKI